MTLTIHDAVLSLTGVRVRYGDADALDVPALDVRRGEVLAIIGPNGSGKSTLLRVLGLLEAPTEGAVSFEGRAVSAKDSLPERRRMATVFQQPCSRSERWPRMRPWGFASVASATRRSTPA